MNYFWKRQDP